MEKQVISKLSDQIFVEAILKKNNINVFAPTLGETDYRMLELIDKFKKFIGRIGDTFYVNVKDRLSIPEGQYKILKFVPKKNDTQINVEKLDGRSFRKKFKLKLKDFLLKKHIW